MGKRIKLIASLVGFVIVFSFGVWAFLSFVWGSRSSGNRSGEISTTWRLWGPNDKVVVDWFDDPKIKGVRCYISKAQTGGIGGAVGVAEDTSDASISCIKLGPVQITEVPEKGEKIGSLKANFLFKTISITRFYDADVKVAQYVVTSSKLIEGSPKNAISAVKLD